ncbi:MAG: molybdopterin molybdenumtransferase MoeA [Anaerolineales bacterium]|nr:molybdopterin molybdenumtransferase MoeA [Anaerolineales bacterium]
MPEFLNLLPPQEALNELLSNLVGKTTNEEIDTVESLGRVTAEGVISDISIPTFPRSTVDGYAVRALDTYGASEALPAFLNVVGEVLMGSEPKFSIEATECGLIHTGGMLPQGSDAVVMVEYTQEVSEQEIEVMRSVAVGENVLKVGEDVVKGQEVFSPGTYLRPAEIGGLMAIGITRVKVVSRPRVGILSTGDEVVPPDQDVKPGQVRDINSYTLSALVEENGGVPIRYGILADKFEELKAGITHALSECDIVVVTAGSSVSVRDLTADVINQLGEPGVLVHGVNIRPGKPTILAVCDGKAVIGLSGNPVSGLVNAELFVVPVIAYLQGIQRSRPRPAVDAKLLLNLSSQAGREDWIPVLLHQEGDIYQAEPIFGKSNLIFSLARANGLLRIPPDATGLNAGEVVQVRLL